MAVNGRLRVGRIPYVNCYPVYGAIDRGVVALDAEIDRGVRAHAGALPASARSRDFLRRTGAECRTVLEGPGLRARRSNCSGQSQLDDQRRSARAAVRQRLESTAAL